MQNRRGLGKTDFLLSNVGWGLPLTAFDSWSTINSSWGISNSSCSVDNSSWSIINSSWSIINSRATSLSADQLKAFGNFSEYTTPKSLQPNLSCTVVKKRRGPPSSLGGCFVSTVTFYQQQVFICVGCWQRWGCCIIFYYVLHCTTHHQL